jgi:hypothetical protein
LTTISFPVGGAARFFAGAVNPADDTIGVQVLIPYAGWRAGIVSAIKGDEIIPVIFRGRGRQGLFVPGEVSGFKRQEYHVLAGLAALFKVLTIAGVRCDMVGATGLLIVNIGGDAQPVHNPLTENGKRLRSGAK